MGHKKWKYKIIYPEYRKCDEGMDIRIRPLKLYDENGFAPKSFQLGFLGFLGFFLV